MEDKSNRVLTPILRFAEFEGEWKRSTLGKCIKLISGRHLKPDEYNTIGNGVPYFTGPSDFTEHKNQISKWTTIGSISENGNTLLTVKGSGVGTMSRQHFNRIAIGRQLMALKPVKIDSDYLYQFLPLRAKYFERLSRGNMIPGITRDDILTTILPLPSLPEQQKIATFLTAVDGRLAGLRRKRAALERYKRGVMQQLLSGERRLRDEKGMTFPKWETMKLGRAFRRIKRKNTANNQNILTISAQQGLVNQQDYFNKSVAAKDVTGYYLIKQGEFAYNKSYSKGYPYGAIKRLNNYEQGVLSTLYICFSVAQKDIHSNFMEQYFEGGMLNHEVSKIAQEGARNHGLLNVSVVEFFKDIKISVPSLPEQRRIATFLRALDDRLALVERQLAGAEAFKRGLLQRMFV